MKCSLAVSNFLEDISSLPHFIAFLYFFFFLHCSLNKAFLSLLAILWNSAFRWVYFPFCPLRVASFLFSPLCKAFSESNFALLHLCFLGMVLITTSCTKLQISIHYSSGPLSDLIPGIFLSLPLYNHKGPEWPSGFPSFLQFKSVFHNKDLMIWATVSLQFWFCQLYRASLSLAAKNIIILILIQTISWCPCVELSLVFLKMVFIMTHVFSHQNSFSLSPASFCTPRPNLHVTPGISWFLYLHSSPLHEKEILFWCYDLDCNVSCHRTGQLHILWH